MRTGLVKWDYMPAHRLLHVSVRLPKFIVRWFPKPKYTLNRR